jgi:HUS1 checkpoint protein
VHTLVQVPDLPQLQSLVDRLKNVRDLLTVVVAQYGDLHQQVSTSLVTVGSEFRKLRVLGDHGKIWHCVIEIHSF